VQGNTFSKDFLFLLEQIHFLLEQNFIARTFSLYLRVYKLHSNPCISTRECRKILKICQKTKFDMSFQKNNMRTRSEKFDFFESCGFLRQFFLIPQGSYYAPWIQDFYFIDKQIHFLSDLIKLPLNF
jgi:hypothetical protein